MEWQLAELTPNKELMMQSRLHTSGTPLVEIEVVESYEKIANQGNLRMDLPSRANEQKAD
jgi:hypothetical protein